MLNIVRGNCLDYGGIYLRGKHIYIIMIFTGVLLQIPLHFGYALGDFLIRILGFSPWTKGDEGFHLPFISSTVLLIWGIKGVLEQYASERRILWRIGLGCIVLVIIFPMIVEKATFMIRHNTTGLASIDYSKKKSECSFRTEASQVKANCSFTLYNYGDLTAITLKPVLKDNFADIQFEPMKISISPHGRETIGMLFSTKQVNGNSLYGGSSNNMDVAIALP